MAAELEKPSPAPAACGFLPEITANCRQCHAAGTMITKYRDCASYLSRLMPGMMLLALEYRRLVPACPGEVEAKSNRPLHQRGWSG